jgi:hypothetical protein
MATNYEGVHSRAVASATSTATVRRGEKSLTFIYMTFSIILAIEGTLFSLLPRLGFFLDVVLPAVILGTTSHFFLFNARFQDKLIMWKIWYESKAR